MGLERYNGKYPIYEDSELNEACDNTTLGTGSAKMGNGEYATTFNMSEI